MHTPTLVTCGVILAALVGGQAMALETPRYTGSTATADRHDGGLRWAVGVQEHALFRPTRNTRYTHHADGSRGTTYNHAMMLAYWQGRFYCSFHGSPTDTWEEGSRAAVPVYLCSSTDGRDWTKAHMLFPAPKIGGENAVSHQRNGFYRASNGRLLAFTFMGDYNPNDAKGGYARLVREITGPSSFGPVYAVRFKTGFSASNTPWQPYTASSDSGFKAAVAEAIGDRLWREGWNEEDDRKDLYLFPGTHNSSFEGKAFSSYRLPDKRIVGMWKGSFATVSQGDRWVAGEVPTPVRDTTRFSSTFYNTAKQWCERAPNGGQYGMYLTLGIHQGSAGHPPRTPLVVMPSADGWHFDQDWLTICGDVHPMFYANPGTTGVQIDHKDGGPSYVRGLEAWDQRPSSDSTWVTYSVSKEDVWVAEVPTPIRGTVSSHVDEDFAGMAVGGRVRDWNIRDAGWCPVRLVDSGGRTVLRLADRDPYDYAKAFRIFPESSRATVTTSVVPRQNGNGMLEIALVDRAGLQAATLRFDAGAAVRARLGGSWTKVAGYAANAARRIEFTIDCERGRWSATLDGSAIVTEAALQTPVASVERIEYRTGPYRQDDWTRIPGYGEYPDSALPGADDPVAWASFDVTALHTSGSISAPPADILTSIDWVSSGAAYREAAATNGTRLYIDRDYALSSLPASGFEQGRMIRTRNDDDGVSTNPHLRFTVADTADVYVAYHTNASTPASWMAGWTDTGITVSGGGAGSFRLWRTTVPAGQVALGGNERGTTGAQSCYFVVVTPSAGDPPEDPPIEDQQPYGGSPAAIAASGSSAIECEDYDLGGEGVSWHDTTGANEGGAYRSDSVDCFAVTGGGYGVGWTGNGEWLEYSIDVARAGSYRLDLRVANGGKDASGTIDLDGTRLATVAVANTGGWQNWRTIDGGVVQLPAGRHVLRLRFPDAGWNADRITLSRIASGDILASIDWVSSGASYVEVAAANGTRLYIDRDYTLSGLPSSGFEQARMIRTRNDDDGVASDPHLRFTVAATADVYVAYSTSATSVASWMAGWTDTGITVSGGGAGSFRLWRTTVPAGQVTLGGNERGTTQAQSCYGVIVTPAADPSLVPVSN